MMKSKTNLFILSIAPAFIIIVNSSGGISPRHPSSEEALFQTSSQEEQEEGIHHVTQPDNSMMATHEMTEEEDATQQLMEGSTPPIRPEAPLNPQPTIIPPWFDEITLFDAVAMGDLEAVKYRIGAAGDNATAEREDRDPFIPIHAAAANGELDVVKYLVQDAGVPVDSTDQYGRTSVLVGFKACHLHVIKYLVEKGADLRIKDTFDDSALYIAVKSKCVKGISYLLEQGAAVVDPNAIYDSWSGSTLLHIAVSGKRGIQTVAALLDGGARLEAKNKYGLTPLHLAISGGAYVNAIQTNMIEYLIARGANLKTVDIQGNNLLDTAAKSYNGEVDSSVVEYLVNSGVKLKEKTVSAFTRRGHPAGAYLLGRLRNSSSSSERSTTTTQPAPPNLEDMHVVVPLEYKYMGLEEAIWNGDMDAVRFRISTVGNNNNNISVGSYYDGICPMRAALSSGNLEMVKYLVEEAGLDVNNALCDTNDYPNETPLHASMQLFHFTPVGQLVTRASAMDVVRYLMSRGANPNATDLEGKSPLQVAAQGAYLEPVQYLIESGADVNAKDKWGHTALHEAAQRRSLHIAYYLVEHGASVNARNERGLTPLASLIYRGRWDILPLLKYLVRSGADINVQFQPTVLPKLEKIADYRITVSVSDFLREAGLLEEGSGKCKDKSTPPMMHHIG